MILVPLLEPEDLVLVSRRDALAGRGVLDGRPSPEPGLARRPLFVTAIVGSGTLETL